MPTAADRSFNPRSHEGSDFRFLVFSGTEPEFQSTLPRRERPKKGVCYLCARMFQSTLPRRERRPSVFRYPVYNPVSIHAPTKGATLRPHTIRFTNARFNPRSHEGSDCLRGHKRPLHRSFNPRSHEGSDAEMTGTQILASCFNPRSHEGSDHFRHTLPSQLLCFNPRSHEGSDIGSHPALIPSWMFQSTLPRRERRG